MLRFTNNFFLNKSTILFKGKWSQNIIRNLEGLTKLFTTFTILNKKFSEINLIRYAIESKENSETEI